MRDDYMWWKNCTCAEAQEFADKGIPAIGIDTEHAVLILPVAESIPASDVDFEDLSAETAFAAVAADIPLTEPMAFMNGMILHIKL